jgi:CheY-like chemotaxis protein
MRRVLIVEDDRDQRARLSRELGGEGWLHFAESGRDAIELIATLPEIAAVVVDLEVGGRPDGFDVLRAAMQRNPDAVRILVSARSMVAFDHDTAGLVDTFFGKPWVHGTIRHYLRSRLGAADGG